MHSEEPAWKIEGEKDKPWMSLCAMRNLTPDLFKGRLFDGLNMFGGMPYYCWLGYIHIGLESPLRIHLKETVDNLNALPTDEIIFYHDECLSTLWVKAPELGLSYSFKPIHFFEYLLDYVKKNHKDVHKLGLKIAYQQPDSQRYGPSRDPWLDELFELLGVTRVARQYDRRNALCCSLPLMMRDRPGDAEKVVALKKKNIDDAISYGATHMVFSCPWCFWALRKEAAAFGLKPLMIADLVKMAFGE
jgi:Fe-S oxidoreductase